MATAKKTTPQKATTKNAGDSADFIKIAPLHHPKSNVSLEELGKTKEDTSLFGAPAPAGPPPHLNYYGGPLLTNVKVYTIFWGKSWARTPAFVTLRNNINAFFKAILVSPLIDQLNEYNRPGKIIGHGSLIGSKVITAGAPATSVTDATIQAQIKSWQAAHTIPASDPNTLYFVYTDIHVKVIMGGGSSCVSFCGYHNSISDRIFYAVMPFPSCAGCLGGLTTFNALTGTSSHELCEAITDPIPGRGWYDTTHGENGDICAWTFKTVSGFNVQKEWSNAANACI